MVARGNTISEETRQKMSEGRDAARASARIIGFPIHCTVQVNTPRERVFHGKIGKVTSHNMGEAGVSFGGGAVVWFLPATLIRIQANGSK